MISVFRGTTPVGGEIELAATFGKRFLGLMFRKRLNDGGGMLIMPCGSVHMCFMRMPLDIVYLDAGFRVLTVEEGLRPWRVGKLIKGAKAVLELPAGSVASNRIKAGDTLRVAPPEPSDPQEKERGYHGIETAGCC